MRKAHNMAQFITVDGVDRKAMIADVTKKATTMANMRADMIDKTLQILTPKQRTKFVTLLQADNHE